MIQRAESMWLLITCLKDQNSKSKTKSWKDKKKEASAPKTMQLYRRKKGKHNERIPSIINFPQDEGNCKLSSHLVICCNISRVLFVSFILCRSSFLFCTFLVSSYFQVLRFSSWLGKYCYKCLFSFYLIPFSRLPSFPLLPVIPSVCCNCRENAMAGLF